MDTLLPSEYKQQFIKQGIEQGIEQGEVQNSRKIVLAMHAKVFPLDLIADVTGVDRETIQAWIAAQPEA